jgi:protein-L-isoaspartate(D-aspartate) O-methyltransferase
MPVIAVSWISLQSELMSNRIAVSKHLVVVLIATVMAQVSCAQTTDWAQQRKELVAHLKSRGVSDATVLSAMGSVPRHKFIPSAFRNRAYQDSALPLAHGQTVSQPYIVAMMTELAQVEKGDRVLEVGTGSGYQAAVLRACGAEVFTIEIVEPLAREAEKTLAEIGIEGVHIRVGDGYRGWPGHAPFQAIIVTAAPEQVPPPLLEQLAVGGRLVIPEGKRNRTQRLRVYQKNKDGIEVTDHASVRFVPMTGETEQSGD